MTLCLAYSIMLPGGAKGDTQVQRGVLHTVVREQRLTEDGIRPWIYLEGTRIGAAENFLRQMGTLLE